MDHQQETPYSQSWSYGPFERNRVRGSPTRNTVLSIMELCFFWVLYSSRITSKKHCTLNCGFMVLLIAIGFKDHQLETLYSQSWSYVSFSAIQFKDQEQETLFSQLWSLGPFECNRVQGAPTRNIESQSWSYVSFECSTVQRSPTRNTGLPNVEFGSFLSAKGFNDHQLETLNSHS